MSVTTSISAAAEPSLLYVSTTTTGTPASTDETTLASYTLPANTLSVDGDYIEVTASGSFAANGNNKTVRLYFGAEIFDTDPQPENNKQWELKARIFRTGATSQKYKIRMVSESIVAPALPFGTTTSLSYAGTASETLTSTVAISVTGQNGTANANDIILETFTVEHKKQ